MRAIRPLPTHPHRRPLHLHAPLFDSCPQPLPLPHLRRQSRAPKLQLNPPIFRVSIRIRDGALNAREEVVIVIDARGGGEAAALDVDGGVADARALGPFLVAESTGEGTGAEGATRALVFWGLGGTIMFWGLG